MSSEGRSRVQPLGAKDGADDAAALLAEWPAIYAQVQNFTRVPEARLIFAFEMVTRANQDRVEGDIVEAGVYRGGASMAMALAQRRFGTSRRLWLYDTFEGLPPPNSPKDDTRAKVLYSRIANSSLPAVELTKMGAVQGKWNYASLPEVRSNMLSTGYPPEQLRFIQGKVEDTLQNAVNLPDKIAVLRLDTDWYESTKAELDVLFRRLQPGGLLFIDDYCAWQGSRTATDEFFQTESRDHFQLVRSGPFCAYGRITPP